MTTQIFNVFSKPSYDNGAPLTLMNKTFNYSKKLTFRHNEKETETQPTIQQTKKQINTNKQTSKQIKGMLKSTDEHNKTRY